MRGLLTALLMILAAVLFMPVFAQFPASRAAEQAADDLRASIAALTQA